MTRIRPITAGPVPCLETSYALAASLKPKIESTPDESWYKC